MRSEGQPNTVLLGYLEGVERKDAESYARAFARRSLKNSGRCWFSVESLWSGYLYEIHEGGGGRSFLPSLVKEVADNPGGVALLPSGRRVFEITVRNGRPVGALLSEEKSRELHARMSLVQPAAQTDGRPFGVLVPAWAPNGHVRFTPIIATRRMTRLGSPLPWQIGMGAVTFVAGVAVLIGGSLTYGNAVRGIPKPVPFEVASLPHRQWESLMGAINASSHVGKLEYKDGKWTIEAVAAPD